MAPAAGFEYHLEDNLLCLQQQLRDGNYHPGRYSSFHIHEPKRRLISAAPFRDRVVHHALCNVIEPLFERRFIDDSYANRLGKGTHRALDRCQAFARRYPYVLQCDVRQFFPSIDHAILRDTLSAVVDDRQVMQLAQVILNSGAGVLSGAYTFTRTFDFVSWLMPRAAAFPRQQRFVVTKRLQDAVLDFYECIVEANADRGKTRLRHLHQADIALDKIRHYLRLCAGWKWLSAGQHHHAAQMVAELGALLGGWQKATLSS